MRGDEDEVEAVPSALHNQLVEQRDDVGLWSVYADQLQRDNDPRGALISLMLERERVPSTRLYEAEVAHRTKHRNRLLPRVLRRHADSVVWRRGFPVGIPAPTRAVLDCTSPSLAFVETAYVQATFEDWDSWLAALAQRPWRRIRLEVAGATDEDELALEPLFAALPQVEHLQLVFPDYEAPRIVGGGAAPRLRHLAFDNAAAVTGLADLDAPALADLRFLTTTVIEDDFPDSELCAQLQYIVASDVGAFPSRLNVVPHVRIDRDDFDGELVDAFLVVGQLVDASLIEDVARELRGLSSLALDIGHVVESELTAVRLRSFGDANLLPYGFAVTLANHLAPKTPIALLHESHVARGFAPATGMRFEAGAHKAADVLRALLDHQSGRDPGTDVHADVQEALACGTRRAIWGSSTSPRMVVLTDIDPQTLGPLPEIDDPDFQEPVPEHEVELYSAPAETKIVVEEIEEVAVATDDDDGPEFDDADEVEEIALASLSTDTSPDGRDAWLRLLATWEDRELDELATLPQDDDADFDVETAPADASVCQDCEQGNVVTYACVWCGGHHCATCSIKPETGGIWCNHCIKDLAAARVGDPLSATAYDDEVFDAEVAEDAAELRTLQHPTVDDDYDQDEWA